MPKIVARMKAEEKKKSSASSQSFLDKAKQEYVSDQRKEVADAERARRAIGNAQTDEQYNDRLQAYKQRLTRLGMNYGYNVSGAIKQADAMGAVNTAQRRGMALTQRMQNNMTVDDYYQKKYAGQGIGNINLAIQRLSNGTDAERAEAKWLEMNRNKFLTEGQLRYGINEQTRQANKLRDIERSGKALANTRSDRQALENAAYRMQQELTDRKYGEAIGNLSDEEQKQLFNYGKANRDTKERTIGNALQSVATNGWNTAAQMSSANSSAALEKERQAVSEMLRKKGYSDDEISGLLDYSVRRYGEQEMMQFANDVRNSGNLGKAAWSVASVPMNLVGGVTGYVDALAQRASAGEDPFTGMKQSIDYNSMGQMLGNASSTIRSTVGENMGTVGNFFYQTGMSMLDFLAAAPTGAAEILLAGSAAQQAMQDAHRRGASDKQALEIGFLNGAAEAVFEHLSLENVRGIKNMINAADGTWRGLVKSTLTQAGVEGSEEFFTTLANTLADSIVMGDQSEINQKIQAYMLQGMTEKEATKKAWLEWTDQALQDLVGGALSGGTVGGIVGGGNTVQYNRMRNAVEKELNSRIGTVAQKYGKQAEFVKTVYEMNPDLDVPTFDRQFEMAYELGKAGASVEGALQTKATSDLTERQIRMAWEIGKDAGVKSGEIKAQSENVPSSVTAQNAATPSPQGEGLTTNQKGVNVNGAEAAEAAGGVGVRGGSERNAGTNPAQQVQPVESGAGQIAEGRSLGIGGYAKDSGAADLSYKAKLVSTDSFGLENGTSVPSLYVVDESSLPAKMKAAVQEQAAKGVKLTFVSGLLHMQDGPNGNVTRSRGFVTKGGKMFVQVDHPRFTWEQLYNHEDGHTKIWNGEIDVEATMDAVRESMDEKEYDRAIQDYSEAYYGVEDDDAILQEIVCDAQGGMNIFEGTGLEAEKRAETLIRTVKEKTTAGEQTRERAPPKEETRNSREIDGIEMTEQEAEDVQEELTDVGVMLHEENASASPDLMNFSRETWTESEYVRDRNNAARELAKALKITQKQARKYIDDVNGIAKMIADDRARLDYESSEGRSSFVGNTEYGGSIDFSTVCKKRRLYTGTIEAIQRAFPDRALTADELLKIRSYMKERGYEVNCGFCYVEGSRAKMGKYTKQFLDEYRASGAEYVPTMAEMNTATGQEQIRKEHPEVYDAYVKFMNKLAQRKPKLFQLATAYNGEILQKFKNDDKVTEKNYNGGLRLQSFSDFEIIHLIDTMQVIMDMSRVGLAGQAYTKVPDFAWAFGNTGLKINLSLVAKGVDENGKLIYDDVEGMDHAEAKRIRDAYSKNVGTILVVFDDQQLKAAMADDFVDFIIPFHRSQWSKKDYAAMGLAPTTKDYTSKQNERYIKPVYGQKRDGSLKRIRAENFMPNTYWDFKKSGKENAEEYLRMCAEANKRPKFANLLVDNKDGSYSLQPDGSTDGYWKLLIDFKMYDNDGKGSPQKPVRPDFNMAESQRMLDEYTGGHNAFPVAQDVVDHFTEEFGGETVKHSRELDTEYMAAVESGDMETAQKMVEQAARTAGYNSPKLYHGTNTFGFTKIDPRKSNNRISFFATDSEDVAGTYSGTTAAREIGTNAGEANGKGIYQFYANTDGFLEFDANGEQSNHIDLGKHMREYNEWASKKSYFDYATANNIAKYAKEYGYPGVIIRNVIDTATPESRKTLAPSDVYVFLKPKSQVKSADPVTYDDKGNVIPLSERFNPEQDDIRYSRELDDLEALAKENKALKREVEKQAKAIERWKNATAKARRETKLTTRQALREGDVKRAVKNLLKDYNSEADAESVTEKLNKLGDYLLNGEEDGSGISYETVRELANDVAKDIIDAESVNTNEGGYEVYQRILQYTKGKPITVSEKSVNDILDGLQFGSMTRFNDHYKGKIRITTKPSTNEAHQVYAQLSSEFPSIFPEDVAEGDMIANIADAIDRFEPVYGMSDETRVMYDTAVQWAADDVIDRMLDESVRQMPKTFADEQKARLEKAIAKERARSEQKLNDYAERSRKAMDRLRRSREKQIADLKQHYKEKEQRARERRNVSATWKKIQALGAKFHQIAEHPAQAATKHASPELARKLAALADVFSVVERKRSAQTVNAAIQDLRTTFSALKDDPNYGIYWSEELAEINDMVEKALKDVPAREMSAEETELAYRLLQAHMHNITNANKFATGQWAKTIWETGRDWSAEVDGASPVMKGWLGDFLNWQLRPDSFFRRISGFAKNSVGERVQKMFSDGTEKMLKIQQDAYYHFRKYTESKAFDKLSSYRKGDLVDVGLKDVNGKPVLLTRDMMLAVYMHLSNEQNLEAATFGGFDVPEYKAYYTGHTARSYDQSTRTMNAGSETLEMQNELKDLQRELRSGELSPEAAEETKARIEELERQINDKAEEVVGQMLKVRDNIADQLTQYEKDFVQAAHEWMQKSADYINAETLAMYGIEKAQVPNYWPMHRNLNFVNTDMRSAVDEINLENWGSLKERVKSRAPLKLSGFGFEIDNHTRKMSQYCGYAAAQRDFNKLYNTKLTREGSSLQEKIQRKFGSEERKLGASGQQYIDAYIAAVSGADKSDATVMSIIRRNLPRATLTLNLRVAMSQLASMPTAAAEVGWDNMIKGLPRGLKTAFSPKAKAALAEKDPWFWQRYRGEGGMREFADMKEEQNWLDRRWNDFAGLPVVRRLVNWCQDFDVFATASMRAMSEEWVKANTDLKPGTEEFEKAVSDKYADVIRKTQPNYTVTERSGLLRDKREMYKLLTMYKTQSNQNLNVLYDANATLRKYKQDYKAGRNGVTKEDVKAAERQFARSYTAVILGGSVSFALLRTAANAILHAMNRYRDDDDELTLMSVLNGILKETVSAMAGMFAFGSEVYDIVLAVVSGEKYYGMSDSAMGALSDVVEQGVKVAEKAFNRDKDVQPEDVEKLAKNLCNLLGIPYTNGKTIVNGVVNHVKDAQNGEFLSFNAGVERTAKQEANRIVDGYLNGEGDRVKKAWDELLQLKDGDEKKAQETVRGGIKDAWLAGDITDKQALDLLKRYGVEDEEKAKKNYLLKWQCKRDLGIEPSDLDDAYLDGDITKKELISAFVKYRDMTKEEAGIAADKIDFAEKYGFTYGEDNVKQAFIDGDITSAEAMAAWKKFGNRSDEAYEKMLKKAEFARDYPGVDPEIVDNKGDVFVTVYDEYAPKTAQDGKTMDEKQFMRYALQIQQDLSDDKYPGIPDGKGGKKPYSVMDDVAKWINSLPISEKEKIALLLTYTNGKTTSISRYKWS